MKIERRGLRGRSSLGTVALLASLCLLACGSKEEKKAAGDETGKASTLGPVSLPVGNVTSGAVKSFGGKADWGAAGKSAPEVAANAPAKVPTKNDPSGVSKAGIPAPISGFSSVKPTGFRVAYAPSKQYDAFRQALQQEQVFESIAGLLNQTIKMGRVVDIQLVDCGTVNAFYDPNNSRIIVCYELLGYYTQMFAPVAKNNDELGKMIVGATLFAFFHELGHGLIHQLSLPATGREEDAVDQMATLILMEGGDDGVAMAMSGAQWFALESAKKEKAGHQMPFWDEHALDQQRFYNIACMIYGSDPAKYQLMVKNGYLPEQRAMRCPEEYQKLSVAWDSLLKPHLKDGGAASGPVAHGGGAPGGHGAPGGGAPGGHGAPGGGAPGGHGAPAGGQQTGAGGGWSGPGGEQPGGGGWGGGAPAGGTPPAASGDNCQAVADHVGKLITAFVQQQAAGMPPAQQQQVQQELAAQLPVYVQAVLQMCTQQNWTPAVRQCVLNAKDAQTADKCTVQ